MTGYASQCVRKKNYQEYRDMNASRMTSVPLILSHNSPEFHTHQPSNIQSTKSVPYNSFV